MTQNQTRWYQLLRSLLIGGSIAFSPLPAIAQLRPIADDTLGTERSQVTPFNPAINQIDGGARRGANLFHSFREFNIDVGRGVYFTNPAGVANILTRVTGGNPSQILGVLGVDGTANLFLINPRGILFGSNAQLNVGGSFLASIANSLVFNNGFAFSATNPQAPPLLTINVPIGLQYGSNPGAIQVQGSFLQVPNGQTLTLAGGAVNVDGAGLFALGGRVELVGVADAGVVGLTQQGQDWRLNVPDGLARADVEIANDAFVDVSSGEGGSIAITARNFTGTGASTGLRAGIAAGLGNVGAQAGDININTTEAISLDASTVENIVGGIGNAGDINITASNVSLTNGAYFDTTIYGQGNAGDITVRARDAVSFDGVGAFGSGAYSWVNTGAIGQGGDISITSGSLFLTNGARVSATVFGQGDAGNITVNATGGSDITEAVNLSASYVNNSVQTGGIGNAGNISITTGTLYLTNGANVFASTSGQGNAGNITITARDAVSINGVASNGATSGVYSEVGPEAIGRGGDISITTGNLSITNGADNRAEISTDTFGQGNAGDITITARDAVFFDGSSNITSSVNFGGAGRGGDINITTGSLALTNGAQMLAATLSQGNAGNITINARDTVSFDGTTRDALVTSGVSSIVGFVGAMGRSGNVSMATGTLSITNGAALSATTFGQGDAGTVTVTARDAVFIDGADINGIPSGIFSRVGSGAEGQGGKITVNTELFSITNRGELTASSEGQGNAGNLEVNARQLRLDNQGSIQAETVSGQGGNITLQVQDYLLLRRGSLISTTAGTAQAGGDGGNITFNGNFIVAVANENSDISANAFTGSGGKVNITAQGIFGIQFRPRLTALSDITASSTFGIAGVVAINTPDVDPNRGLVPLPVDLTDASRLIVQNCPTGDSLAKPPNQFIITGRGGLPPTPSEAVNRDAIQVDLT